MAKTLMLHSKTFEQAIALLGDEAGAYGDNGGDPDGNCWLPSEEIDVALAAQIVERGYGKMVSVRYANDDAILNSLSIFHTDSAAEAMDDDDFVDSIKTAVEDKFGGYAHYGAYGALDSKWILLNERETPEAEDSASKEQPSLKTALESFIASPDFKDGVISSTKAGFGGSGYSVELFEDGSHRVLWNNQIGNLYQTPGVILSLPQIDPENLEEIEGWTEEEVQDNAFDLEVNEFEQELRDALAYLLDGRRAAAAY